MGITYLELFCDVITEGIHDTVLIVTKLRQVCSYSLDRLLFCLMRFIMKSSKIISKKLKPKIRFLVAVNFFFFFKIFFYLIERSMLAVGSVGSIEPQQ